MQAVTRYVALDGTEHLSEETCREREKLIGDVAQIMSGMPARPNDTDYSNGKGYLQHDAVAFQAARNALLELANRIAPMHWLTETLAGGMRIDPSWAHRWISDVPALEPVAKAWYRIMCTDKKFREWGQPFFSRNPSEGEMVRVNP